MNAAKILMVEDNAADVELTSDGLRRVGAVVDMDVVDSPKLAFEYLEENRPDMILLDLKLAEPNGWDILAFIKSDPALKHIPVIIMTGFGSVEDKKRAIELGANGYVEKPVKFAEIIEATGIGEERGKEPKLGFQLVRLR